MNEVVGKRFAVGRGVRRAVVILAVVASMFAVDQAPASASLSQCNAFGYLCAWSNENYGGIFKRYPDSAPTLGGDNDRFDSLWNRDGLAWAVHVDAGFRGAQYCLRPGYAVDVLADWGGNLHDKISSVKLLGSSSCGRESPIGFFIGI